MLCRIDRTSLEATVRIFPFNDALAEPDPDRHTPDYWTINDPVGVTPFQDILVTAEGIRINGYESTALVNPETRELHDIVTGR